MKTICPFCKKETADSNSNDTAECENHGKINVIIYLSGNIEISNSDYLFYISKKYIELYKITYKSTINILNEIKVSPPDQIITPENFEQKLKTYLLFL